MAALAGTMLLWPGTALQKLWTLNPPAHAALARQGKVVGPLFYALSFILMITALGWFRQRVWAWRLAVVIIASQVIGDFLNVLRGDLLRACTGLVIAGALLVLLLRSNVRELFH
jgi:mannose/fructose/N-acetylgalactosamine-specific phosphotransferase system component IID